METGNKKSELGMNCIRKDKLEWKYLEAKIWNYRKGINGKQVNAEECDIEGK